MSGGCTALVAAAGSASRMGGIDKILAPLNGNPLLLHTLRALAACPELDAFVIVTRADLIEPIRALCASVPKPAAVYPGGASRSESVLLGLRQVRTELVAVHDGARPLVTPAVVAAAVERARQTGAAAPAVPVHDTVKVAQNGRVRATPERATLFAVQTPQVFRTAELVEALRQAIAAGKALTDDCSAMELAGKPVWLTPGDVENLKVTTPIDLALAETILKRRNTECGSDTDTTSTG